MTQPMDFPTAPRDGDTQADTRNTVVPTAHRANLADDFRPFNATGDVDRDDELPDVAAYEGPAVPEAPVVNPSAGNAGPSTPGINPQEAGQAHGPGQTLTDAGEAKYPSPRSVGGM